jgi:hypothetical protein
LVCFNALLWDLECSRAVADCVEIDAMDLAVQAELNAPAVTGQASSTTGAGAGGGGGGGGEKPLGPRKERSKSREMGKRMGGGQKGVWGNSTEILKPVAAVDDHDPNYDSEGEEGVVLVSTTGSPVHRPAPPNLEPDELAAKELAVNPPPEIKKRVIEIIDEYFTSGDVEEVKR